MMAAPAQPLLAAFEAAATAAGKAETAVRKRAEAEIAAAERERAFAYRRLNLMRTLAHAVAHADSEEAAVARGLTAVRAEIGWASDSDTRTEALSRLAPAVRATFACLQPVQEGDAPGLDVAQRLADFEAWYERVHGRPFWGLYDRHIEEMPLVER
jgi:hypothetical protein